MLTLCLLQHCVNIVKVINYADTGSASSMTAQKLCPHSLTSMTIKVGTSLFGFLCESLFFLKRANRSFALFGIRDKSELLFFKERFVFFVFFIKAKPKKANKNC